MLLLLQQGLSECVSYTNTIFTLHNVGCDVVSQPQLLWIFYIKGDKEFPLVEKKINLKR
jgi:hypothetical protein